MSDFELMTDPRFPLIHEALRTINQLLLVLPKVADALVMIAESVKELVPLAKWYLVLRALMWLWPGKGA